MNHPDQITLNVMKRIIGENYLKYITKPIESKDISNDSQQEVIIISDEEMEEKSISNPDPINHSLSNTKNNFISESKETKKENDDYDEDFVDINDYSKK